MIAYTYAHYLIFPYQESTYFKIEGKWIIPSYWKHSQENWSWVFSGSVRCVLSWNPLEFYYFCNKTYCLARKLNLSLPRWLSGKESDCNAGDSELIRGLGRSPKKEMATHSSILAWRIPWREEPGGYSPWGHKESNATEWLSFPLNLWRDLLACQRSMDHIEINGFDFYRIFMVKVFMIFLLKGKKQKTKNKKPIILSDYICNPETKITLAIFIIFIFDIKSVLALLVQKPFPIVGGEITFYDCAKNLILLQFKCLENINHTKS